MRALILAFAEFVMRGRLQAAAVAVLGYIVPLITPATVALVTLRKGAYEGTIILLFGLSPALLSLVFGESSSAGGSAVVWITLLSLAVVYVPALILRFTMSLPAMITGVIFSSTVVAGAIVLFAPDTVDRLVELLASRVVSPEGNQDPLGLMVTTMGVSGMIAYLLTFNGLIGVLVGRWLQALAFNPGGFGGEFRELRLGLLGSIVCFVGSIVLRYSGDEYWWWSNIMAIPLVLVAIAIAHYVAKVKQLAAPWLVLFYFAVFIFMPLIVCIGFLDAWMNFRNRLQKQ